MDSIIPGLSISICIVTFFILFISSHFYAWLAMTLYSPPPDPQFYRLHMPARHNKGGIRHFVQSLREGLNEKKRFLSGIARMRGPLSRLEICQKFYTTEFSGQKFYTLKVRTLRLFFLKKKQRKCINLAAFLLEFY